MKEYFLKGQQAGLSFPEIAVWIDRSSSDPRTWSLKSGAPRKIVDIFPEYIEFFLDSGDDAQDHADSAADYSNASTLFVTIWQLARNARSLVDIGIASNIDRDYISKVEAHAQGLEKLRDQMHDALLTDEDKAKGAVAKSDR